jgi:hypothetical protein
MVTTQVLRKINLFSGLDDDVLEEISGFCSVHEYTDGEIILYENGSDNLVIRDLYLLIDGVINIVKHPPGFKPLKKIDIHAIDTEVYGEIGWLLGSKPSAELSSSGNSKVLLVDGGKLFSLCDSNPKVGYNILYGLAVILAMRLVNQTQSDM